jgi:two-component system nitrate/nitrite response regulator NarL
LKRSADGDPARRGSGLRVLICDDHVVFAEAFATLLRRRGFEVVTCVDPIQVDDLVRERPFDVCLMDFTFPGEADGVECTRRLRSEHSAPAVVMLTGAARADVARAASMAGASGFVSKTASADVVVESILRAHTGAGFFAETFERHSDPAGPTKVHDLGLESLTAREAEVLMRMVSGETAGAIALNLGISYATARTHVQRVLVKLGTHSVVEAVAFAARQGLRPDRPAAAARS